MIKKILKIGCAAIAVVFLVIGIIYSSCPVVPFAEYRLYNEDGSNISYYSNMASLKEAISEDLEENIFVYEDYSYLRFSPNENFTIVAKYTIEEAIPIENKTDIYSLKTIDSGELLAGAGFYTENSNLLFGATISAEKDSYSQAVQAFLLQISDHKTLLTYKDGSYAKTTFNPTFIFYIISALAMIGEVFLWKEEIKNSLNKYRNK